MQRLDRIYITLGLVWVIIGMVFGVWLGASNHTNFANSHAHINLLGFVTSTLFGMLFWAYPDMGRSRLAIWQLGIYEVGIVLLVIGKVIVDNDGTNTPFLIAGSLLTIIGTVLMLYLFTAKSTVTNRT